VSRTSQNQARNFIFLKAAYTSTSKFTRNQRDLIKNIIAMLSIKRIPEQEIIKAVFDQTNETISDRYLYAIKQQIKRESYQWYKTMREGQYELSQCLWFMKSRITFSLLIP
jgi:hypothetical protein